MSKGGRRPGAGRPKGAKSRLSAHAVEQARKTGELPHEFLLRICRGEQIELAIAEDGSIRWGYPSLTMRFEAAVAAAPYFAPKLAAIEQKSEIHVQTVISDKPLTEKEWEDKYAAEHSVAAPAGATESAN